MVCGGCSPNGPASRCSRCGAGSSCPRRPRPEEADMLSDPSLLTRPLLKAVRATDPVVLLIDEGDRVEVETEALLLEVLSDFQVSIPELGTITGTRRPFVL